LLHAFAVRVLSDAVEPDLDQFGRGDVISLFVDEDSGAIEFIWMIRWTSGGRAAAFGRRVNDAVARNNGSWEATSTADVTVITGSTRAGADLSRLLEAAATAPDDAASARRLPDADPATRASAKNHALSRALARFSTTCSNNALVRSGR
jgi:enoyl-CoA hydratase/carnithine racemase